MQNSWNTKWFLHVNSNFPHGGIFNDINSATEKGRSYYGLSTGISLDPSVSETREMKLRFVTKIYCDITSLWGSITGGAVFADNAVYIGPDHVDDEKAGRCTHPKKDKHHGCDECHNITPCLDLELYDGKLCCKKCVRMKKTKQEKLKDPVRCRTLGPLRWR